MFNTAVMVTVDTAVLEQLPVVPVTVYEVDEAGLAVAVFTPVDVAPALQVYEVAPPAERFAVCPGQIVGEFTVTIGKEVMVTVDTAVFEQLPTVPVTV